MFGKLFGKKDAEAAEDGEAKGKPKGKGKTKDKVEPEIEAPSAAQEGAPPLDGATPPAPAEGGESAPVNPDTAAAIEAARKASQAMDKPSLAFGSGKDDEPVIKKKKKDEDEESPEDEFQTQKKKLPVQPILQGAVTFVFLLIMGGMSGWILTRDPPPPLPGHLVEFEMPELGRGYAGQQGAPGVAAPPVDDYASLEPIDMNLLEDSAHGLVPKTSEDGKEPWAAYRRPFSNPDKKPRVGLVFVNMGLSRTALEAVVGKVPGAIALAFQPYGRETERGMDVARASGHETYIMVPFEPSEHPLADPGPHVLLTKLEAERNLDRLDWVLSRSPGFVGITYLMGDVFLRDPDAFRPVMETLKQRGLMWLDTRAVGSTLAQPLARELGVPIAVSDVLVDRVQTKASIDAHLAELEKIALKDGYAIGVVEPHPVTIARVLDWAPKAIERGLIFAPPSALAWKPAGS